jgi:hypothetical protein
MQPGRSAAQFGDHAITSPWRGARVVRLALPASWDSPAALGQHGKGLLIEAQVGCGQVLFQVPKGRCARNEEHGR